jgi:hypothetical protein
VFGEVLMPLSNLVSGAKMHRKLRFSYFFAFAGLCLSTSAMAQSKPQLTGPGSLVDTFRNTKLWADPVEPKEFVRESRPADSSLEYQPTTGTDPERKKKRSPAELQALQSELEAAGRRNEKSAGKKTSESSQKPSESGKRAEARKDALSKAKETRSD